jgi:hypothetical protein
MRLMRCRSSRVIVIVESGLIDEGDAAPSQSFRLVIVELQ